MSRIENGALALLGITRSALALRAFTKSVTACEVSAASALIVLLPVAVPGGDVVLAWSRPLMTFCWLLAAAFSTWVSLAGYRFETEIPYTWLALPVGTPAASPRRVARPSMRKAEPLELTSAWTPGNASAALKLGTTVRRSTTLIVRLADPAAAVDVRMTRSLPSVVALALLSTRTPLSF